jgi:serine protease AprX
MRAALLALLVLAPAATALAQPAPGPVVAELTGSPTPVQRADLAAHGFAVTEIIPAAIGSPAPADLAWLRAQSWVARVAPAQLLQPSLDLSTRLIRAGRPVEDLGGYDGSGVTVAVLDSGLDAGHPDFQGRIMANVQFVQGQWVPTSVDMDGHGTHVAGIVGGSGASSGGVLRGVAPGAGLIGMDFGRAFTTTTALLAFDWVLQHKDDYNIRVVTNSWGRAESPNTWDPGDPLVRASTRLVQEGIVVVFSAGNHGPGEATISLEGQNPNVITVGAVDDAAVPASFSGRGPVRDPDGAAMDWVKPDLVAAGVGILSTRSAQATGPIRQPNLVPSQLPGVGQAASEEALRYTELSGTSQAAPHVAGIAALMLQANPALTPADIHNLLREASIDLGPQGPDPITGFGLIDARDAVRLALGAQADRGNVLVVGGEETYTAAGTLSTAAGQLVQTSPFVQAKPQGAVEATFPIKVGATGARFDFAWSPPATGFRVYVVGPLATLGPWTASELQGTDRVVSGRIDDPDPGVYRLVARPTGTGASASYHATMIVDVMAESHLPAKLDERYRAPGPSGPTEQVAQQLQSEFDRLGSEWRRNVPGPEPLLGFAGVGLAALLLRRRRPSAP